MSNHAFEELFWLYKTESISTLIYPNGIAILLTTSIAAYCLIKPSSTKMITALTLALATAVFLSPSCCENINNADLTRRLRSTLTQKDFMNEPSDADMVFDFSKALWDPFHPGSVINANAESFPILIGSGISVAQLNLGPCSMLAPHLHPRAHNLVVAITGETKTYLRTENGAKDRVTKLSPGKMTMFNQGSMHCMVNEGCHDNLLYSFLSSDDPGTLNIAQAFWSVGQDIAQQVMPMIKLDDDKAWNETGKEIPDWGNGAQDGFLACRKACGLVK